MMIVCIESNGFQGVLKETGEKRRIIIWLQGVEWKVPIENMWLGDNQVLASILKKDIVELLALRVYQMVTKRKRQNTIFMDGLGEKELLCCMIERVKRYQEGIGLWREGESP